jgi:hypothetical protein
VSERVNSSNQRNANFATDTLHQSYSDIFILRLLNARNQVAIQSCHISREFGRDAFNMGNYDKIVVENINTIPQESDAGTLVFCLQLIQLRQGSHPNNVTNARN